MESYGCTACSRTYKRRWRLQRHFRLEHTDKSSVSGQSEGANNSLVGLYSLLIYLMLTRISCSFIYLDPSSSSESLGNNQPTSCKVCSKVFMTKQSLKAHVITHVVVTRNRSQPLGQLLYRCFLSLLHVRNPLWLALNVLVPSFEKIVSCGT